MPNWPARPVTATTTPSPLLDRHLPHVRTFLALKAPGPQLVDELAHGRGAGAVRALARRGTGGRGVGKPALNRLVPLLQVVRNNTPQTPGGGGTPRREPAPELVPKSADDR